MLDLPGKTPKNKFKDITSEILGTIYSVAGEVGYYLADSPKRPYRKLHNLFSGRYSTQKINSNVSSLRRRGYLSVVAKDPSGSMSIHLTDKGKIRIADLIGDALPEGPEYHFISFDIPETKRQKRDTFRKTIKRLGFRQVQKSLWVCNKNIGDLVDLAIAEHGVEGYVVYIVARKSNIDRLIAAMLSQKESLRSIVESENLS